MKVLVTGGAGFIGRWVVKKLLDKGDEVYVFDNFSGGSKSNLNEFEKNKNLKKIYNADISDAKKIKQAFSEKPELCIHLAAQINVQESIDEPDKAFRTNILGTYNVLEEARKTGTKIVIIGTCMVYDLSKKEPINEEHPVKPLSPYASSKLAAENLALSYFHCYGLPVVVLRPFNTYGPFQRTDAEGGVVAVFLKRFLDGNDINIFGDGNQTRDLLYVEDCADFIVNATFNEKANGHIINAGTGKDVSINKLAEIICKDKNRIKHTEHPHPQSEIRRLVCDSTKAKNLLGWKPKTKLNEGIKKTAEWINTVT